MSSRTSSRRTSPRSSRRKSSRRTSSRRASPVTSTRHTSSGRSSPQYVRSGVPSGRSPSSRGGSGEGLGRNRLWLTLSTVPQALSGLATIVLLHFLLHAAPTIIVVQPSGGNSTTVNARLSAIRIPTVVFWLFAMLELALVAVAVATLVSVWKEYLRALRWLLLSTLGQMAVVLALFGLVMYEVTSDLDTWAEIWPEKAKGILSRKEARNRAYVILAVAATFTAVHFACLLASVVLFFVCVRIPRR